MESKKEEKGEERNERRVWNSREEKLKKNGDSEIGRKMR